jgi:hypothetical protein
MDLNHGFRRGRFLSSRSFSTNPGKWNDVAKRSPHLTHIIKSLDVGTVSRNSLTIKVDPKGRKFSFLQNHSGSNETFRSGLQISALTSFPPFRSLFSLYFRTI